MAQFGAGVAIETGPTLETCGERRYTAVGCPHLDGMRIVEYLMSFVAMFRQAESEQAMPDPDKLAQFNVDTEGLVKLRSDLVELSKLLTIKRVDFVRGHFASVFSLSPNE